MQITNVTRTESPQVPDIQSEPDVIDIASYNLRPRNPLGVVRKNEYLHKG